MLAPDQSTRPYSPRIRGSRTQAKICFQAIAPVRDIRQTAATFVRQTLVG